MFRWVCVALFALLCWPSVAGDCLQYKKNPAVYINTPDWTKVVVQPRQEMNLWHGNVVATMIDNYDIVADINQIDDGFCVGVKSVSAEIGYNNFIVQIDMRHTPDTCKYDAILAHEDKHIKTYLSVMDDLKKDLQHSLYLAVDSVMPVFVRSKADISHVIDEMNKSIQLHPELVVIKQKINAEQEIRNKKIDQNEDNSAIKNCG
jgi:hypothetical protein